MQFRTASMSAMLAITKHAVCVGIIAPCLVNLILTDTEAVQNCISTVDPTSSVNIMPTSALRVRRKTVCYCFDDHPYKTLEHVT